MRQELNDKFTKWAIGILTTGLVGAFSWAWNLNADLAVIQSNMLNDRSSNETKDEILKDWSSTKSTQEAHARQLRSIWEKYNDAQEKELRNEQRLTRIETNLDNCCY